MKKADADVERAKKAAEDKRWRLVADHMKAMKVSTAAPGITKTYCVDHY